MATQRPWNAQTAVQDMGTLSDKRVKRWFKKSASEQYKYAKSLSPQQRDELEAALAETMRGNTPEAGKAFTMWLSVQQARLRTHSPEEQAEYRKGQLKKIMASLTIVGTPAAAILLADGRSSYYQSEARPEYAKALKNFSDVIGDTSLSDEVRQAAAARLQYHAFREGTLTPMDTARLQMFGVQSLVREAPAGATLTPAPAASGLGPNDVFIRSVEEDLAAQRDPLGDQINQWMAAAGQPPLHNAGAFDHEEGATAFARVLNRRMDSAMRQPRAEKAKILQDGVDIIRAVAQERPEAEQADGADDDVDLQPIRPRVFSMATVTLGSCVDNVSEGFSNMVAMVANHQMACDVKAGRIDQPALAAWSGQKFRLDALEKEVHVFLKHSTLANHQEIYSVHERLRTLISTPTPMAHVINTVLTPNPTPTREDFERAQGFFRETRVGIDTLLTRADIPPEAKQKFSDAIPLLNRTMALLSQRKRLLHEPMETMLHAKVKLRDALALPETTSSTMMFHGESMLDENSLRFIAQRVRAREADPNEMNAYLLSNSTWRAGMKQFHPDRFKALQAQFDDDPFWEMLGADVDEDVPNNVAVANIENAAADLQKRMKAAEDNLLLECAGPRAPGDAKAAVLGNLTAVRARFAGLSAGNWQTAIDDEKHDAAILPALVMSENARRPDLNLHLVSPAEGLTVADKVNQLPLLARQRVMFSLPPENRHITADVRRSRGKTSIIAIDPLSPERGGYKDHWQAHYLPFLKSQFGEDATITVLTLDTQIAGSDSRIYGLSHASKMADNAAMFDALHRQNISGAPLRTSLGGEAKQYLADGNIRLVDGMSVLPADFVKHAQSEQTLDAWMQANPRAYANASVNKKGQTLAERHNANATTRVQAPQQVEYARMRGENPAVRSAKMSTSIERKRLAYIDRAMAYFSQAPAEVSAQALTRIQSFDRASSDMIKPGAALRRQWGPAPAMPARTGDAGAT